MSEGRRFAVLLPAGLLIANLMNMAGIVVLPKIIDPQQFALFSIASSVGLFLISIFYEWSRITIIRYGVAIDPETSRRRRSVLRRANLVVSLGLLGIAALCSALDANRYALVTTMACLFAVSQALFEARQAHFRADFKDLAYSISIVMRALLGFILLCSVGYLTNSGFWVMCAWASSFALVLLPLNTFKAGPTESSRPDWHTFRFLLRFGIGVALTAMVSTVLAPLVRLFASEFLPLAESGKWMLAMDISQKIIGVIGVSINILTLQATIRAREFGHEEMALRRIGMQFAIVVAVLLPAVVGFWSLKLDFTNVLIPHGYRDVFLLNVGWCMLAAGILGFRAFALDSIFIVLGRPYIGMSGSIVTVAATSCSIYIILQLDIPNTLAFSFGLCVGSALGAVVSLVLARRLCRFRIEWLDLLKVILASSAMGVTISAVDFGSSNFKFPLAVVGGGVIYVAALMVMNAFDVRRFMKLPLLRG